MNYSTNRVALDINSDCSGVTVHCKRFDTARKIYISLVDGGIPYTISEDCYAFFTAKKPDGHVVINDCSIENNTIVYKLTTQTVAAEGRVNSEIELYGGDGALITSPKFTIMVSDKVYNEDDVVESSDDFSALAALIAETKEIKAEYERLEEKSRSEDAPAIVCDAAGSTVQLTDAADRPLKGLVLYGKTMQNGVPTPQAPIPLVTAGANGNIIARISGKNLWDNANAIIKYGGKAVTLSETGFDFVRGSYVGSVRVNTNIPLAKGQTVTFSCSYTGASTYCYIYTDASQSTALKSGLGSVTYTATEDYPDANFVVIINSNGGDASVTNIQVEFGAEVTGYEAFKPVQPLHISTPNGLPGIKMQPTCEKYNFVEADGNKWLCDEIDLNRGVYVQWCDSVVLDGTENFGLHPGGIYYIDPTIVAKLAKLDQDSTNKQCYHICSHFLSVPRSKNATNLTVNSYGGAYGPVLAFRWNENSGNIDAWKAYLAEQYAAGTPLTVVFGMKNAVETALSKEVFEQYNALYTAKGETTISNDGPAFMKLSYIADTKLHFEQRLAAISAAILNN